MVFLPSLLNHNCSDMLLIPHFILLRYIVNAIFYSKSHASSHFYAGLLLLLYNECFLCKPFIVNAKVFGTFLQKVFFCEFLYFWLYLIKLLIISVFLCF